MILQQIKIKIVRIDGNLEFFIFLFFLSFFMSFIHSFLLFFVFHPFIHAFKVLVFHSLTLRMLIAGIPLTHIHMQNNLKSIAQDKLKSLRRGCVPLPITWYLMGTWDITKEQVMKPNQVATAMSVHGPSTSLVFVILVYYVTHCLIASSWTKFPTSILMVTPTGFTITLRQ